MILRSARLLLREPEPADATALRDYHVRNAERFAPWDPPRSAQIAEHVAWIAEQRAAGSRERPVSFVVLTDALVGLVGLSGFTRAPATGMIAYSIDGAFEGQGYASEAVARVAGYAFGVLGLDEISAHYHPDNARSERLLQRLGFRELARSASIPGLERLLRPQVMTALARPAQARA